VGRHNLRDRTVFGNRLIDNGVGILVKVARRGVAAATAFEVVANAVLVRIGRTIATTNAQSVELVAIAVAIVSRLFVTATIVNGTRTVADATSINGAYAVVHIVAHAIAIGIGCAVTAANIQGIQHVAVAITGTIGKFVATAVASRSGAVADAAFIQLTDAVVHVVANAIVVGIGCAVTATHAQGVELVAIAITVTCGKGCTAAIINRSRTVADVTSVKGPYTVVNVVADVIAVGIGLAVTAAAAQSVFIQAVLVAAA